MSKHVQPQETVKLTKADFVSDQNVRWCPGCGDYSILANVQKVMPELGVAKENIVFISGIGCSSRFPYYMNTYGFHTIHGRAPAVATGLKLANPKLSVWVVTGDGDALSIGGNHFIHLLRRNVDVNLLLFNNRIYGLTKGQYSPTSEIGKKTKSTPNGSVDAPLDPIRLALASGSSFVARSLDVDPKGLQSVLKASHAHSGTSFVEIYQNCNIFNDNAFIYVSDRAVREDRILKLENGQPMIFGKERNKGIRLSAQLLPEVVTLENGITESNLIIHDVTNPIISEMLSRLNYPDYPVPMGVFYDVERDTYENLLAEKIRVQTEKKGVGDLKKLLNNGQLWEIGTKQVGEDEIIDEMELDDEINILPEAPDGQLQRDLRKDSVSDLATPHALIVSTNESVKKAIELMQEKNYGCVHVHEDEKLVGLFTDDDIVSKIIGKNLDLDNLPISEVMTSNPITVSIKDSVGFAFNKLVISGKQHLPVIEEGKPERFTSARGLLSYIAGHLKDES